VQVPSAQTLNRYTSRKTLNLAELLPEPAAPERDRTVTS
jgi:hypothetical protein